MNNIETDRGCKRNWVLAFGRFNSAGQHHHYVDAIDMRMGMTDQEVADFIRGWLSEAYGITGTIAVSTTSDKVTLEGRDKHGVRWYGEAEALKSMNTAASD